MSVVVRGKTIITGSTDVGYRIDPSMLSLYVDARNPDSYPGSGTTWYDLSSGMHNISTALATYDSTSPASFSITGNNTPIINFTSSVPTSVFTIETIIKPTVYGAGAFNVFLNFGNAAFRIYFDNNNNILYWSRDVYESAIAVGVLSLNQWQYLVFEMYDGQITANNKIYKNGNILTLSGGTDPLYLTSYNNGMGQIFGDTSVSCSMFRTYNRVLTQDEITNSYNYYKPIYNLS